MIAGEKDGRKVEINGIGNESCRNLEAGILSGVLAGGWLIPCVSDHPSWEPLKDHSVALGATEIQRMSDFSVAHSKIGSSLTPEHQSLV